MSNTLIDNINNTVKPTTKDEGCWDGNTMADLGFTNIQVEGTGCDADHKHGQDHTGCDADHKHGQDQEVSFAEAKWKVQGVRGTTILRVRKKVKTTPKLDDIAKLPTSKMEEKPAFVKKYMGGLPR